MVFLGQWEEKAKKVTTEKMGSLVSKAFLVKKV